MYFFELFSNFAPEFEISNRPATANRFPLYYTLYIVNCTLYFDRNYLNKVNLLC
jgi:hypothetical protein